MRGGQKEAANMTMSELTRLNSFLKGEGVCVWVRRCSLLNYVLSLYLYQQACPYPLMRTYRLAECPQIMLCKSMLQI